MPAVDVIPNWTAPLGACIECKVRDQAVRACVVPHHVVFQPTRQPLPRQDRRRQVRVHRAPGVQPVSRARARSRDERQRPRPRQRGGAPQTAASTAMEREGLCGRVGRGGVALAPRSKSSNPAPPGRLRYPQSGPAGRGWHQAIAADSPSPGHIAPHVICFATNSAPAPSRINCGLC